MPPIRTSWRPRRNARRSGDGQPSESEELRHVARIVVDSAAGQHPVLRGDGIGMHECRHAPDRTSRRRAPLHGFTLVELLVVITIIVILIALLAPALDQAIYQAELAQCGAGLRMLANGSLVYAMDNNRRYPYRPGVADPGANWEPNVLYASNEAHNALVGRAANLYDERTILATYIDVNKTLNDPLVTAVDFWDVEVNSTAWTSRMLWYGWYFSGQPGMMKVGDGFVGRDVRTGRSGRYSVLASDFGKALAIGADRRSQSSHPDRDGKLYEVVLQNDGYVESPPIGEAVRCVISFWGRFDGVLWGPVDLNYAFDDASVTRYKDVKAPFDDRLSVIEQVQQGTSFWHLMVPKPGSR